MDNYSGLRTNLTMLMDFYEITMANGYFTNGYRDRIAYFDMFFVMYQMTVALQLWPVYSNS